MVRGNCWENSPIPAVREEDFQDDECDDGHLEPGGQIDAFLHNELQCTHTSEEVKASIGKLSNEKMISNDVKTGLQAKLKHNKMVEVNQNGKKFYIHKTTAVWLLQESERVSTDRLLRVRAKQPNMNYSQSSHYHSSLVPIKDNILEISDICVFKPEENSKPLTL